MRLELKDVESSMVYTVEPSGAVLGRERARTDINFRDESISKRHARIYADEGRWYLEDLGSSNGTFVRDTRITEPAELTRGITFTLAQRRFEVVFLESDESVVEAFDTPDREGEIGFSPGLDEEPARKGVGAILLAVPKALAYYLVSVPLMAVNPLGALRGSIDGQRSAAMTPGELASYGLVGGEIAGLMGAIFGILSALLQGGFSVGMLFGALPVVGVAAISGLVSGLILHPVLSWLVSVLSGESSPRSRTNFALDGYTFGILGAIPSGLAAIVGVIPIPFPGLIPAVLNLLVSLLGILIGYRWAVGFGVVRWVRYGLIALGAIAVLFSARMAVISILDAPESRSRLAAGREADPSNLKAISQRALAQAKKAADRQDPASIAKDPEPESPPPASEENGVKESSPKEANTPPNAQNDEPNPPKESPRTPPVANVFDATHPRGTTDFVLYQKKLEAIERAVSDDPSLLDRRDVLNDYEKLWRVTYDLKERWQRLKRRKPAWKQEKILSRKEQKDIFERTKNYVDNLYRTLFQEE